ncbi:MAG: hypothetical protein M1269_05135 [Chloroflexi bacterium]|nr:hypothetical protein [Chloroflexota bacterium]
MGEIVWEKPLNLLAEEQKGFISEDGFTPLNKVFLWGRGKDPDDPSGKKMLKDQTLDLDIVLLYVWNPYMQEYIMMEESGVKIKELIYGRVLTNRFIYRITDSKDTEALNSTGRTYIYEPVYIDDTSTHPLTKDSTFTKRESIKSIAAFIDNRSQVRPEYILIFNYTEDGDKRSSKTSFEKSYKKELATFAALVGNYYYKHLKQERDEREKILEAVFDLNRLIPQAVSIVDATSSLEQILSCARKTCGIYEEENSLCTLHMVRKGRDQKFLEVVACHNPGAESGLGSILRLDDLDYNPGHKRGIVGLVEEAKTPFLSPPDIKNSCYYESDYIEFNPETKSEIVVPITLPIGESDVEVIGILNLESSIEGKFKPYHIRHLTYLAPHIAILLQRILPVDANTDLRIKIDAYSDARNIYNKWALTTKYDEILKMFHDIAEKCRTAVNADACMIVLPDKQDKKSFRRLAVAAKNESLKNKLEDLDISPYGMTHRILEQKSNSRGEFVPDVHTWNRRKLSPRVTSKLKDAGLSSVAVVPIQKDQQPMTTSPCGVLYIKYFNRNHVFSQSDQAILELFAGLLAQVITEHVRTSTTSGVRYM